MAEYHQTEILLTLKKILTELKTLNEAVKSLQLEPKQPGALPFRELAASAPLCPEYLFPGQGSYATPASSDCPPGVLSGMENKLDDLAYLGDVFHRLTAVIPAKPEVVKLLPPDVQGHSLPNWLFVKEELRARGLPGTFWFSLPQRETVIVVADSNWREVFVEEVQAERYMHYWMPDSPIGEPVPVCARIGRSPVPLGREGHSPRVLISTIENILAQHQATLSVPGNEAASAELGHKAIQNEIRSAFERLWQALPDDQHQIFTDVPAEELPPFDQEFWMARNETPRFRGLLWENRAVMVAVQDGIHFLVQNTENPDEYLHGFSYNDTHRIDSVVDDTEYVQLLALKESIRLMLDEVTRK